MLRWCFTCLIGAGNNGGTLGALFNMDVGFFIRYKISRIESWFSGFGKFFTVFLLFFLVFLVFLRFLQMPIYSASFTFCKSIEIFRYDRDLSRSMEIYRDLCRSIDIYLDLYSSYISVWEGGETGGAWTAKEIQSRLPLEFARKSWWLRWFDQDCL